MSEQLSESSQSSHLSACTSHSFTMPTGKPCTPMAEDAVDARGRREEEKEGRYDYQITAMLGQGAFGVVYLVQHRPSGDKLALKDINMRRTRLDQREKIQEEAELLSRLQNRHVVGYVTSYLLGDSFIIVTEFCEGGDLGEYLEKAGKPLPEELVVCWTAQIATALAYLHEKNVLHRDLKPQNILLNEHAEVKVADLGLARVLENSQAMALTYAGTPLYMSPEIFSRRPYNQKTDIWSLGCVLYEMTMVHRKAGKDKTSLTTALMQRLLGARNNKSTKTRLPDVLSKALRQLGSAMLSWVPSNRPSAKRILKTKPISDYIKRPRRPAQIIEQTSFEPVVQRDVHDGRNYQTDRLKNEDIVIPKDSLKILRQRRRDHDEVDYGNDVADENEEAGSDTVDGGAVDDDLEETEEDDLATDDNKEPVETQWMVMALTNTGHDSADAPLEAPAAGHPVDIEHHIHVLRSQLETALGVDSLARACSLIDSSLEIGDLENRLCEEMGESQYQQLGNKVLCLRLFETCMEQPS